jgi:hypothetical protein
MGPKDSADGWVVVFLSYGGKSWRLCYPELDRIATSALNGSGEFCDKVLSAAKSLGGLGDHLGRVRIGNMNTGDVFHVDQYKHVLMEVLGDMPMTTETIEALLTHAHKVQIVGSGCGDA